MRTVAVAILVLLVVSACVSPPMPGECVIAPPKDYKGDVSSANKAGVDLTAFTNAPVKGNVEAEFKSKVEQTFALVPQKDVACQMLLQTVACLSQRPNAQAALVSLTAYIRENDKCGGGGRTTEDNKKREPIVLDLTQKQENWNHLTSWLRKSDLSVQELTAPFGSDTLPLEGRRVLILPLPFQELLSDAKVATLKEWVERGGGLLILGYYAPDIHHGSNPTRLTRTWGIALAQDVLLPNSLPACDRGHVFESSEQFAIRVPIPPDYRHHPLFANVRELALVSSTWIDEKAATVKLDVKISTGTGVQTCTAVPLRCAASEHNCAVDWKAADNHPVPVLVAFSYGAGRVVILGTWKALNPDLADNGKLLKNAVTWLSGAQ